LDRVVRYPLPALLRDVLGEGYRTCSYAYDYVADIFTIIMVSADGSQILVFTGDEGA